MVSPKRAAGPRAHSQPARVQPLRPGSRTLRLSWTERGPGRNALGWQPCSPPALQMTSVVSAKNEPEAATFEGRGRGLAPRRRPALGGQPGLGVTVAVLLPPWRAGCHRRWGRERCWAGSREGGPPQRPLASGGGPWSGGREKEPHTQQRSRRRRGRASPAAWGRNSDREARGAEGRGGGCEIRGQRATEGAPGAAPSSGPEQSSANLNPGRAEGRAWGSRALVVVVEMTRGGC